MTAFRQVDVFGSGPLSGNPLAVVHDADSWSTDQMARFANWTNLSETTFLLPPLDAAAVVSATSAEDQDSPHRDQSEPSEVSHLYLA